MNKLKITVIKTEFNQQFADEFRNPLAHYGPCNVFRVGDEFIIEKWWQIPDGFCEWAWIDIQKPLFALATGGDLSPWMKEPNIWIACCTDGVKPVTFKIETIT